MFSITNVCLACVAWRFCRAGRMSGVAAKFAREARENDASAPISSRFLCPRPPLLLSAPNQNRHATQANVCSVISFVHCSIRWKSAQRKLFLYLRSDLSFFHNSFSTQKNWLIGKVIPNEGKMPKHAFEMLPRFWVIWYIFFIQLLRSLVANPESATTSKSSCRLKILCH